MAQLNTYSNVDVLGYVHTSWAARSISDVKSDVTTYQGWASYTKKNISVSGIFFDEAPHTNDATDITYMQDASDAARSANLNTVVFNPGCKLDSGSASKYFAAADLIVEFENSYSAWTEAIPADEFSGTEDYSQDAVLLYSAPLEANYSEVIHEARQMGLGAAYLTETSDYTNADSVSKVAVALMQAGISLEAEGETSSSTETTTSTKTTSSVTSFATVTASVETTSSAVATFAAETTSSTVTSSATVTKTATVTSTSTVTETFTVTATSTVATPSTVSAEAVTVTEVVTVTACPRRGWSA